MTRDPIRRRFGHGAARLPLAMPLHAERLSERARQPVPHERRLTLVLPLVAAFVATLVVNVLQPTHTLAPPAAEEIQIVLQSWPAMPLPAPRPTDATAKPRPEETHPQSVSPRPVAVARRATPSPRLPAGPTIESAPTSRFDPGSLATRAPNWSNEAILPSPHEAGNAGGPASPATRSARGDDSRPMPAGLANAGHSPRSAPTFASIASDASRFASAGERRPEAAGEPSGSSADFASSGRGDRERSQFFAAVDREESGSGKRSTGAAPATRRPLVSAARSDLSALSSGSNGTGVDGWEEVPLDALPDCSPPGRQDLLKKRILLAAPFQRECSHRDGSYRFVETRNLGAFLMWSRPNPDGRAGQPRDRDACDVLERALSCIGDRSSQESSPR